MVDLAGLTVPLGTLPQWGTFASSLLLAVGVLRYLPGLIQARTDRLRLRGEGKASAAREWREIEARVKAELDECRRERAADAAQREAEGLRWQREREGLRDENFRMRIVIGLVLDEVEKLDPDSQTVLKAKALLLVMPTEAEREALPPAVPRLEELLDRIPEPKPRRRRRQKRRP